MSEPTYTLYCGDCLDYMRGMDAGSVDAVITDPPYGNNTPYSNYDDTQENLRKLIDRFIPEVLRIAKFVLIWCGNGNQHLYPAPDWTLCWHIPAGNGYNSFGFTTWQPILAYGKPYRKNGNAYPDSIVMSPISERVDHPCPKPERLLRVIIARYTAPKSIVLDPVMGSGTTGVACMQLGRNFIGCEIDPAYYAIAERRIKDAAAQPTLFTLDAPMPQYEQAALMEL